MPRRRRTRRLVVLVLALALVAGACTLPGPPPYPYWGQYGSRQAVVNEANRQSAALEQYIKDWLDGKVPAQIPQSLIPSGVDRRIKNFYLQRPSEVSGEQQWAHRPAHTIDVNNAQGLFPDPHATYLLLPQQLFPFGSKMIIEGQFPRARYFSIQPTAAFHPEAYKYEGFGAGEVSFVDADINPNAGHTNPFRVGANRSATNRSYRVECTGRIGDPTQLDPQAWTAPTYRQAGNSRSCSGILYRGPWGDPNFKDANGNNSGDKLGLWDVGETWIRYYAPDNASGPYAGVPFPKVTYQLPDGRQYFINADLTEFQAWANGKRALTNEAPAEPPSVWGSGLGWGKQMGIFRSIASGASQYYDPWGIVANKQYVRDLDKGVTGRGESQPGVLRLEPHSTAMVHGNYLTRGMCLGAGKVFTISGRLPTTPKTRAGQATMTGGEARYWSITGYSVAFDAEDPNFIAGVEQTSVMDDEIVTNANNEYTLVYSRPQDRPTNATAANGVTWVPWGPEACQSFTIRWLSIGPEWTFAKAPHELNTGWDSDWASTVYNANKIGRNNRSGFLGTHQPVVGYLSRTQFQGITAPITPAKVPAY